MASANYNRMGFKEEKADVKDTMLEEFTSPLVAELRANGGQVRTSNTIISFLFFTLHSQISFLFPSPSTSHLLPYFSTLPMCRLLEVKSQSNWLSPMASVGE